ncbi:hypothetical protein FA13DRAFT_1729893 [Coprinellus micaceus]|uniref:Uncharacterized protein n=1 Tax=Coprinellus micaceus TaxID=71717 RepID=A0A4Y7TJM4_COPMI|nr:hypothetical protein FA13DRAFT_1729893 [Coprinellus micaceus]
MGPFICALLTDTWTSESARLTLISTPPSRRPQILPFCRRKPKPLRAYFSGPGDPRFILTRPWLWYTSRIDLTRES